MNAKRMTLLEMGLRELPALNFPSSNRNGEALDTDEAAVWKRVLNYRLTSYLKPNLLLETHPGTGISTILYRHASPKTRFVTLDDALKNPKCLIDLIDIDPFGAPWRSLEEISCLISRHTVVQISNGEAHSVRRNLKRGQKYPTQYAGRLLPKWVVIEYLPRLQNFLGLDVQFFYAFPTTVRAIFSKRSLPKTLWRNCPQWMWWLEKYTC